MGTDFEFIKTEIEGLIKVIPFSATDSRGDFTKDYSQTIFALNGSSYDIKEVFYTKSYKGVVRGLHFQRVKQQQKLVRCIHGHIYDVIVDLRKDSATFKKWVGFHLTDTNKEQLLIPHGCAHGFIALKDSTVCYKCNEVFFPEYDDGILWDDEDIGIEWPIEEIGSKQDIILSEKDKNLQLFKEFIAEYGGL